MLFGYWVFVSKLISHLSNHLLSDNKFDATETAVLVKVLRTLSKQGGSRAGGDGGGRGVYV
jgi:hypothetical protein